VAPNPVGPLNWHSSSARHPRSPTPEGLPLQWKHVHTRLLRNVVAGAEAVGAAEAFGVDTALGATLACIWLAEPSASG